MKVKELFHRDDLRIDVFGLLPGGLDSYLKSATERLRTRDPVN